MSTTTKLSRAEPARLNSLPSGGLQPDPAATRHGLRAGPFALLPGEDAEALAALHCAVATDWRPRDAYERHWVGEIVAALWRANRLRRLEVEHLDVVLADPELALAEATVRKLATYARYGARLDADLKRALGALRVLKERPDARVAAGVAEPDVAVSDDTHEPDMAALRTAAPASSPAADDTREPAPRRDRGEPEPPSAPSAADTSEFRLSTSEPEPAVAATRDRTNEWPPKPAPSPAPAEKPVIGRAREPLPPHLRSQRPPAPGPKWP